MNTTSTQKAWFLLAFFPTVAACLVTTLILLAFKYQPGGDPAVAYAISFTLAEGMMLASALGILGTFKVKLKTPLIKFMRLVNIVILSCSGYVGYTTFLQMTA